MKKVIDSTSIKNEEKCNMHLEGTNVKDNRW